MLSLVTILLAGATMFVLAAAAGWVLGYANQAFQVEVDPRQERLLNILPGANCGGCGHVNCGEYAAAAVGGDAVDRCTVGGSAVAQAMAAVMGVEVEESWPRRPVLHCGATTAQRHLRTPYVGEPTCAAANLVSGIQGCVYGCLGFGDCVQVCEYGALSVVDGLAVIDYLKCVGCGACERICPRHLFTIIPFKSEQVLAVKCSNEDLGKDVQAVCDVGCIGCQACVRACDLFEMEANLPRLDYERLDPFEPGEGFHLAIEKCPRESLVFVGRPSAADLAETADESLPDRVEADFETTVDKTEWRG